jgi:hypothetical protein
MTGLKQVAILAVTVPLLALGACATQGELGAVQDEVRQAREAAAAAAAEAREAKALAAAANKRSMAASSAAGDASTKADRMFRQSLRK